MWWVGLLKQENGDDLLDILANNVERVSVQINYIFLSSSIDMSVKFIHKSNVMHRHGEIQHSH